MDSTSVAPITDARICQLVLAGVNAAMQSPSTSRAMYVYVIGPNYAAFDPREQVEHGGGAVVFLDSRFKPLKVVLAPSVY